MGRPRGDPEATYRPFLMGAKSEALCEQYFAERVYSLSKSPNEPLRKSWWPTVGYP